MKFYKKLTFLKKRWTNHVGTYARVFALQSVVTALQLGLVIPPREVIEEAEAFLAPGDTTSNQYLAFQDLKELLEAENGDYMDVLGTFGGKLVTEVFNFPLLDAIFYGFATLVDSSLSRRATETIEGIKAAVYGSNVEEVNDYVKVECNNEALVGNIVTVLNNRKIRREPKTIFSAISELQNRLVGKDNKSKTQAMITHNPREVLIHRCLLGERLTPEEKDCLAWLKNDRQRFCEKPSLRQNISSALTGQMYRKVDFQIWRHWAEKERKISPEKFCKVNPSHLVVKELQADGSETESNYPGYIYIAEKLFEMADAKIKEGVSELSVGVARLLKAFNVSDNWGKVCIPAHPTNDTVEFSIISAKDKANNQWKMPADIRKMENAKYVPNKRCRLLPGIVQKTIRRQENNRVVEIDEGQDIQTEVFREHVNQTIAAKELMDGDGDGQKIIDILFQNWWSPLAVQERVRNIVERENEVDVPFY